MNESAQRAAERIKNEFIGKVPFFPMVDEIAAIIEEETAAPAAPSLSVEEAAKKCVGVEDAVIEMLHCFDYNQNHHHKGKARKIIQRACDAAERAVGESWKDFHETSCGIWDAERAAWDAERDQLLDTLERERRVVRIHEKFIHEFDNERAAWQQERERLQQKVKLQSAALLMQKEQVSRLQKALSFFRSVIKSGESWTSACEDSYSNAMKPPCSQSAEGEVQP